MASGWWKSTDTNLGLVAPVDFTASTAPPIPRNWGKLTSVVTSGGFYLGGTPCVTVNSVAYYAGDNYTQGTDKPFIARYDGRVGISLTEAPYVTGTTPSKAILSIIEEDGTLYYSTWDSGTTSADFVGRVFAYDLSAGTTTELAAGIFITGQLPYGLAFFNSALYVGVTKQSPSSAVNIVKINLSVRSTGGPTPTPTVLPASTTYGYYITQSGPGGTSFPGSQTGLNYAVLDANNYNHLTWTPNVEGVPTTTKVYRTVGGTYGPGLIGTTTGASLNDTGQTATNDGTSYAGGGSGLVVTPVTQAVATTTTYKIGAVVDGIELLSSAGSVTARATLSSTYPVTVSWTAVTGATSYNIYRTAGHSSTGLIGTTVSTTTLSDTGIASTGSLPSETSTIALTTGSTGVVIPFNSKLYIGTFQPAATFGTVYEISSADAISLSNTAAPGGTAGAYNGYTAGIVFAGNLYMAYWNDDATDVCAIHKYTGSAWSVVKTISGAGARPFVAFAEVDSKLWVYGGGDGQTGILYQSNAAGTVWTDQSALLPSSKEAVPFMANVNVLGGF